MDLITGLVGRLRNLLGLGPAMGDPSNNAGSEEPKKIDWSTWSPANTGDVRSPCPALNALANHSILPHDGRGITKAMAVGVLTKAFNMDATMASVLSAGGVLANPNHQAHFFDLDHLNKHNFIEHDVSLSRDDAAFGDNHTFSKQKFDVFLKHSQSQSVENSSVSEPTTTWKIAAEARYMRVIESKTSHETAGKPWTYGIKEAITSYGETGLYLNVLGKAGVAPVKWVTVFFEEERLPYKEGWRPPAKIDQAMLNDGFREMLTSYGHGHEEAALVGVGTLEALRTIITSLGVGSVKMPGLK